MSEDFTLGSLSPATQTVTPGQSASYNFSVLPVGVSFDSAVSLSCSGAPAISLCSFTPNPTTPGNSAEAIVMQVTTTSSSARPPSGRPSAIFLYGPWLILPGLVLLTKRKRGNRYSKLALSASLLGLIALALLLNSCGEAAGSNGGSGSGGGGGGGGDDQQQGTQPGTYTITVTGTSGTLSHQAPAVTLIVNPVARMSSKSRRRGSSVAHDRGS